MSAPAGPSVSPPPSTASPTADPSVTAPSASTTSAAAAASTTTNNASGSSGSGAGDLSKRACDACKFRKTRCSKTQPCATCVAMDLNCTYISPRKKRGPPGKRVGEIQRQQRLSARGLNTIIKRENSFGRPLDSTIDSLLYFNQYGNPAPAMDSPGDPSNVPEYFMPNNQYDEVHSVTSGGSMAKLNSGMPNYPYMGSPAGSNMTDASGGSFSPPFFDLDDDIQTPTGIRSDQLHGYQPGMNELNYGYLGIDEANKMGTSLLQTGSMEPQSIWPTNIDEGCILPLIEIYFERLHATLPVLNKSTIYSRLMNAEHRRNPHFASMLLSLCAFALTQPLLVEEANLKSTRNAQAKLMMKEAVKMQDCADFGENPTLDAILCSFFLFATLFGANQHNAAWLRLREAVTLGDLLRLHDPHSYEKLEPEERVCRLRTYWILCVTERAYALQRRHTIEFKGQPGVIMQSMQEYIDRAQNSQIFGQVSVDELDATGMFGLKQLVHIFDNFGDDILDCWNERCNGAGSCKTLTQEKIVALHRDQVKIYDAWDEGTDHNLLFPVQAKKHGPEKTGMGLKETQKADVLITRHWLLNRLCSEYPELQFDHAETIAMNTLDIVRGLTMDSMQIHGVGLVEKLYDIASCAITASSCWPSEVTSNLTYEQQAYFSLNDSFSGPKRPTAYTTSRDAVIRAMIEEYYQLFTEFRGGDHPYLPKFIQRMKSLPPLPNSKNDYGSPPLPMYNPDFIPQNMGGAAGYDDNRNTEQAQPIIWQQPVPTNGNVLYSF